MVGGFEFSLGFRCHFFRYTKFVIWRVEKNFFLDSGLKGAMEKCVSCFLYTHFRGFYLFLFIYLFIFFGEKKGITG